MKLKDILSMIVTELEETGALVVAIETILIEKNLLDENQIGAEVQKLRPVAQKRLAGLRLLISELSQQDVP